MSPPPPSSTLFPYTTLFRSVVLGYDDTLHVTVDDMAHHVGAVARARPRALIVADLPWLSFHVSREETVHNAARLDRKSTRLNSSHVRISYAVFCLKKKREQGRSRRCRIDAARTGVSSHREAILSATRRARSIPSAACNSA